MFAHAIAAGIPDDRKSAGDHQAWGSPCTTSGISDTDVFDSEVVRSPALPGSQVYREADRTGGTSTKRGGSEKMESRMKKNGEVGQLIGGGWVNLLSAVTFYSVLLLSVLLRDVT